MEFNLKTDYIEMIKLLKVTGIAESGGMAKQMVDDREVEYNGIVDLRKRLKVRKGDLVKVHNQEIKIV